LVGADYKLAAYMQVGNEAIVVSMCQWMYNQSLLKHPQVQ